MTDFDFEELDKAVTSAIEPSPAARRAPQGRFMDMVHPSSDMRQKMQAGTRPFTRPQQPVTPPAEETEPMPSEPEEIIPETQNFSVVDEQVEEPKPAEEAPAPAPESPFLPNAVVEKRPLGAVPIQDELMKQPEHELLEEGDEPLLLEPHTEPRPTDVETSSLYDNEAHLPVDVAKKKRPVVTFIAWSLLVLGLGVGAGVLMYFYVLPLL